MIKLHILCCNDFPERAFLSRKAAGRAKERLNLLAAQEADRTRSTRSYWHVNPVRLGPPIYLPRRSVGGHWEAQLGRYHILFNLCGHPVHIRKLNKDYEYD